MEISRNPSIHFSSAYFSWILCFYCASDGDSLRSVASLWLEFLMRQGGDVTTHFGQSPESHNFHDFLGSPARFKEDFPLRATLPRNVKIDP